MKPQLSLALMAGTLLLLASAGCAEKRDILRTSSLPMVKRLRANDAVSEVQSIANDQTVVKNQEALPAGAAGITNTGNKDPSSGRLFLKKFLMFKNLFSNSNSQPVIPIIITGAGTATGTASPTAPTVTVTSTGTIPSATGTITTSPTSPTTTSPTGTTTGAGRQQDSNGNDELPIGYGQNLNNEAADENDAAADDENQDDEDGAQNGYPAMAAINPDLLDEQALQAALAAGAQEYEVVTNEPVQGTAGATESKATQNNRINLRRKSSRRGGAGQVISVRIPPRYRRYFKNGQKVMLNTNQRPNKRRVVRKRVQPNRNRNKNKKLQQRRRRNGNKNQNRRNKNKNKNKNKGKRPRIQAI